MSSVGSMLYGETTWKYALCSMQVGGTKVSKGAREFFLPVPSRH